jgi:uncharacterized protein YjbJ (UPF0337 family)
MEWSHIASDWEQFKKRVGAKWEKLTDEDLAAIKGRRKRLEGKIRQRYGFAADHIRKDVDDWMRWQEVTADKRHTRSSFLTKQA